MNLSEMLQSMFPTGYSFLYPIFGGVGLLIAIDLIIGFLLSSISGLWRSK